MVANHQKRAAPGVASPVLAPILALDYGRKRIGLAVSDALGVLPRPIETLLRKNRRDDIRRLREIARENGARLVVIGHPLRLDGSRGEMADEVERFAKRLASHLGLPVELMDERLTSWEAEQLEDEFAGPLAVAFSKKGEKHGMDSVAAAIILRDYLEQRRATVAVPDSGDVRVLSPVDARNTARAKGRGTTRKTARAGGTPQN